MSVTYPIGGGRQILALGGAYLIREYPALHDGHFVAVAQGPAASQACDGATADAARAKALAVVEGWKNSCL